MAIPSLVDTGTPVSLLLPLILPVRWRAPCGNLSGMNLIHCSGEEVAVEDVGLSGFRGELTVSVTVSRRQFGRAANNTVRNTVKKNRLKLTNVQIAEGVS
jgi:hypothetical protein